MTAPSEQLPTPAEQDATTTTSQAPRDPFLALLVRFMNGHPGNEMGVTLHVNGVIISGMMCSMSSFFDEQADVIRRSSSGRSAEDIEDFAKAFDWLSEQSLTQSGDDQAKDGEVDETEAAESDLPEFIHLRAATVHAPGTDAVLPETLWRGRLEHVSGWTLGNFGRKLPRNNGSAAE